MAETDSTRPGRRPILPCERCRSPFRWNRDRYGRVQRFCSQSCAGASKRDATRAKRIAALTKTCRQCGAIFRSRTLAQQLCGEEACLRAYWAAKQKARMLKAHPHRADLGKPRACLECGKVFIPPPPQRQGGRRARYCSRRCGKRAGQRTRKLRFKVLRGGGLWDAGLHPEAVFRRDRWACQLCGKRTPRRLVGSNADPNAPTVDHIVPIAHGGGHTWDNVQCLCRRCNIAKSATVKGQLRLAV